MSSWLDKLNLRPGERRLVVIVGLVLFIVLNVWQVWPQFGQVAVWEKNRSEALQKLAKYNEELKRKPFYEKELKTLEGLGGVVASEEQALQLQREVSSQAGMSGVGVDRYDPAPRTSGSSRTNSLFEEQTLNITVNTGEKELVDFLYSLTARGSLIRVRGMTLQPDPSQMRLKGNITLVESFQKKPAPRVLASAATRPTNISARPTPPALKPTNAATRVAPLAPAKGAPAKPLPPVPIARTNPLPRKGPMPPIPK